jgi:hypothetical protein
MKLFLPGYSPPILLCSACLTEACADGILMCEAARTAALVLAARAKTPR